MPEQGIDEYQHKGVIESLRGGILPQERFYSVPKDKRNCAPGLNHLFDQICLPKRP